MLMRALQQVAQLVGGKRLSEPVLKELKKPMREKAYVRAMRELCHKGTHLASNDALSTFGELNRCELGVFRF